MGAKCCLLCQAPYAGYHPYPADVTKLGNNQRNQYGSPNPTFNSKFAQPFGQSTYQPLQQNQTYQPPQPQSHMVQNQAYQRNTSHYAATTQLPYQGYNKGSLNDVNHSPYHNPAPTQPPNYQETINNLYHRQQEQNHYQSKEQLGKYANPNKLQQNPYSNYNAYSAETSPVHHYSNKALEYNGYTGGAQNQSLEQMNGLNNGLSNYHNYDIDRDYQAEDYKAQGDEYGTYGRVERGLLDSKGNLDYSDTDLTLVKQQHAHQQQLLQKEEEELKAEERRRKIISDVVRDETQNGLAGVSAGELLNKTHEELVLLLIQLRRQHSALQEARKHARTERDSQAQLSHLDSENRDQHLDQLAITNRHLLELDKQYEMGKPLINLVDNMVKLGTLYRGLENSDSPSSPSGQQGVNTEGLEFSRRVQERRIVDEDRQEFEMLTPDQADLEGKVLRLYNLEHTLQRESLTIQALQTDKEALERALYALQSSSSQAPQSPEEIERRHKQQLHLERELSKLRAHLAMSAGKLEETAAENSRLEHEMMMLRQKIQQTMARNARRDCGDGTSKTRHIESEMIRVQELLEDLQNRRMHLSQQIQRLTMSSTEDPRGFGQRATSPSGLSGSFYGMSTSSRRRTNTTWLETDLDRMITQDRGLDLPESPLMDHGSPDMYRRELEYGLENPYMVSSGDFSRAGDYTPTDIRTEMTPEYTSTVYSHRRHTLDPSYVQRLGETVTTPYDNRPLFASSFKELDDQRSTSLYGGFDRNSAANKPDGEEQTRLPLQLDDSDDADERMKRFYGLLPKEKPLEPKTVRIVKRESTERRKDRTYGSAKKVGESPLPHVLEDDLESDSGEPTSEPELDSESSPAHLPLASSISASTALKGHQHLSSSYSSGYSSSSQTYLQPQQPSYPPSSIGLYQAATDYPSSSVASVPDTSNGKSSNGDTVIDGSSGLPSYSARTASLPRNYGRGNEWGDKPNRRAAGGDPHVTGGASASGSSSGASKFSNSISNSVATTSRPSNLPLKQKAAWKSKAASPRSQLSAMEQLFGQSPPESPGKPEPPSPVFKSAAAQEIIKEMASEAQKYRRAVPKEKRRHVTISSSRPMSMETPRFSADEGARSRDDCDMARALRPRNHPDVVKSTLSTRDLRINETTIDSIFGAPSKIHIPERYVPDEDDTKEDTPEERRRRENKAESIRRMLTDSSSNLTAEGAQGDDTASSWVKDGGAAGEHPGAAQKPASKVNERKEREHILAMNQILARQVMEKSRLVAARANAANRELSSSDDDMSPLEGLPMHQQRENMLV